MKQVLIIEVIDLTDLKSEVLAAINNGWETMGGVFQPEGDGTLCVLLTKQVNP